MPSFIPLLISIDQPLPHAEVILRVVKNHGWRDASYQPGNDSEWLLINTPDEGTVKPVTIEQVRALPSQLSLQRVLDRPRIVVIQGLDKSHQSCQHALLKVLEEVPADTILVVSCSNLSLILPTILSRCVVEKAEGQAAATTDNLFWTELQAAIGQPADQVLAFSDRWKDRDQALAGVKATTTGLQAELEKAPTEKLVHQLQLLQSTYWALQANANVRLQLEELVKNF